MPPPVADSGDDAGTPPELGFDALKRRGIELAQALSAAHWTDYNLHDPGVTILEQACYALTDLAYRVEFDVADHLVDDSGRVDYERLALRAPEEIFPSRPATLIDYRGVILDAVPGVENVWLRPLQPAAGESAIPGLYRILVRPREGLGDAARARLVEDVRDAYLGARNLCEDVESVNLADETECVLRARVEVQPDHDPAELLAAIYHRCARFIAGDVRLYPFELARRQGRALEDVFSGPLGRHGYWQDEELARTRQTFAVPEFHELVKTLDGVEYVHALHFEIGDTRFSDSLAAGSPDAVLRLHIPRSLAEIGVTLSSAGRQVPVSLQDFQARHVEQDLEALVAERTPQDPSKLYGLPSGVFRDLRRYTSIQDHFPAIYGITPNGLPDSAPADVKARALQLRGYLLLFDQLMANFTGNVGALRDLFAARRTPERSYVSQALDTATMPGLEQLYPEDPEATLAALVARYDAFGERKGRLLDYLLALYGEQLPQQPLRNFAVDASEEEKEAALLDNKLAYLEQVASLGRDRGAGACHGASGHTRASGLQRRVAGVLGLSEPSSTPLSAAFAGARLSGIVADEAYAPGGAGFADLDVLDGDLIGVPAVLGGARLPLQAPDDDAEDDSLTALLERDGSLLPLADGRIPAGLLQRGVALRNYRLGHLDGSDAWQLCLGLADGRRWCRLAAFDGRDEAVTAGNRLRRLMVRLNRDGEGLHVVEHLLLRPRGTGVAAAPEADFYAFRVSVVFPAWPARFAEPGFHQLAEDTVRQNCPAHVTPAVLWLALEQMRTFERLQALWLQRLAARDRDASAFDEAARRLSQFLAENGA